MSLKNYNYRLRTRVIEVKEMVKKMWPKIVVGPDSIYIEVWKRLGDKGIE